MIPLTIGWLYGWAAIGIYGRYLWVLSADAPRVTAGHRALALGAAATWPAWYGPTWVYMRLHRFIHRGEA